MPKVNKNQPKQAESKVIKIGTRVRVVTEYVVKRMPVQTSIGDPMLVAVEDARGDRVLNFRLDELEAVS